MIVQKVRRDDLKKKKRVRERERPGSAAHQVWVELQVEIDLVVTVTWQSRTRSNAKKRKTPSREYFRESEGNAQKFLIRCSNNLLTVHLQRGKKSTNLPNLYIFDSSARLHHPLRHLQVEGSRVAS